MTLIYVALFRERFGRTDPLAISVVLLCFRCAKPCSVFATEEVTPEANKNFETAFVNLS